MSARRPSRARQGIRKYRLHLPRNRMLLSGLLKFAALSGLSRVRRVGNPSGSLKVVSLGRTTIKAIAPAISKEKSLCVI